MNTIYYYPAIFTTEDIGFSVRFPDFPGCYTQGDSIEEAYRMSSSAIGLYVQNENENFVFPKASSPNNISLGKDEFLVLIEFNLIEYLKSTGNESVKKTLTIPSWLNSLAEQNNVNFSNVLQNALIERLNVNN